MLLRGITQQCFESLMMNIMLLYHAQSYMFYNVRTTYRTLMKEKSTLKYCKLQESMAEKARHESDLTSRLREAHQLMFICIIEL